MRPTPTWATIALLLGAPGCSPAPETHEPAGFDTAAARARGRELFVQNCALCHGVDADGHGQRQQGFNRTPANFTDPSWGQRISPSAAFDAIRHGKPGTDMPPWYALTDDEIWALVAYLRSVATQPAEPAR